MLINYLPQFMQDIEEIKSIMFVTEEEVNYLNQDIESILNDFFIIGSSKIATKHYEKMLEITPKLTDSIEKRQYDILAIYNQTLPFTLENLQNSLDSICGEKNYSINMIYDKFILNIILALNKKELFEVVNNLLERIVPMNLIINLSIDYNVWKDLNKFKWKDIKKYKWCDIKESQEIK
ncbi:putative phage tail protein [[Clostridium] colinum]|uniref:putative phage tail protein n=1 Tax=[Clostridium] colinum TaxID=36835 RepID=UPI0020247292|nr:putative phage tail protein [[Clostridium] colinum]